MAFLNARFLTRVSLIALAAGAAARAQSFTYTNFSSPSGLQINGNAAAPAVGKDGVSSVLRLTPATGGQAGSAFFNGSPIQLGNDASFSTAFSFQMWNGAGIGDGTSNPPGADGIVFVLGAGTTPVGASGQGVGYQGIANSVGIKFDTWDDSSNGGFPNDNDPNGNFAAIYTDGDTHLYDSANPSDSYNNLQHDATTYYSPSDSMKNGNVWYAWIDYNGTTDELDVSLSETDVRPGTPDLSEIVDLSDPSILGNSPEVYAGFTAGTGGAWDNQDILGWQFNDSYNPIQTVGGAPDATSTGTLLLGVIAALAAVRRRKV